MGSNSIKLQAFIDDSASEKGDKRFFMAGFIARPDIWDGFSKAWAQELRWGRPIAYLKMSEAKALRGEFRGWTRKQVRRKLARLVSVIHHFKPMSFHASVPRNADFERYKAAAPRGLVSPHFLCGFLTISGVARYFAEAPNECRIEYVFDTQAGVDDDTELFFDEMIKRIPDKARKLIAGKPQFLDDQAAVALQAADLLAWHLRRNHEERGDWGKFGDIDPIGDRPHLHCGDLDGSLVGWAEFDEQQPGIDRMKTKSEWKALKGELRRLSAAGYIPPHGTHFRNFVFGLRDRFRALSRRWRR